MGDHAQPYRRERAPTGVPGLDEILGGGLPTRRIYLVQGGPGTGKTTLGFQFVVEGAARGESTLYVSLLQTREELEEIAESHGWSLDGVTMLELPREVQEAAEAEQTVFTPAEVELDEVTEVILQAIEEHRPRCMVLDSISELQIIVDSPHQLRRQLIKLKRAMLKATCTALWIANEKMIEQQPVTQTIVHGAITLNRYEPGYGALRRSLEVEKVRAIDYATGLHDLVIHTGGLVAYPRLPAEATQGVDYGLVTSGNEGLDTLFGGGLSEGTTCLVMGTSGVGKSTLTALYAAAVADRGGFVSVYSFDESSDTYMRRAKGLELGITKHLESGRIELRQYRVGELSAGELMHDIRQDVEERSGKLIIIDSYTGYLNLMPHETQLATKLHELLRFLSSHGVLTLVTFNLHGLFGPISHQIDASHLADTVVLMRHFEAMGQVRQCISVIKKRHGRHERSIREVEIGPGGLRLGPPLHDFSGVLTSSPRFEGRREELLEREGDREGG